MPRSRRVDKASEWSERLRRFARSGQTITAFCIDEEISQPSFFLWRRRLGLAPDSAGHTAARRSGAATVGAPTTTLFQQVVLDLPNARAESNVTIRLATGVRIRIPAENTALVRAVVADLATRVDPTRAAAEDA